MPLTEDEWRAFINEHNGGMNDVEAEIVATLERNRRDLGALARDARLPLESEAISATLREAFLRTQG